MEWIKLSLTVSYFSVLKTFPLFFKKLSKAPSSRSIHGFMNWNERDRDRERERQREIEAHSDCIFHTSNILYVVVGVEEGVQESVSDTLFNTPTKYLRHIWGNLRTSFANPRVYTVYHILDIVILEIISMNIERDWNIESIWRVKEFW